MYESVRREIPEFLIDHLIYCDNLTTARNQRTCILLTKNLKFLEFQRKKLLRSIDLNKTCLQKLQLQDYNGSNGKFFDSTESESKNNENPEQIDGRDISFGKYIYRQYQIKILYIIIKCWDKLVVLEHRKDGFKVTCEYEEVLGYKLVHGKIKYQLLVEIYLKNNKLQTNFNETNECVIEDKTRQEQQSSTEFKQMLERVRNAKTELQLHKAITQKEFQLVRNQQTFGCNFLRHWKLEEKQLLTRCGDIWIRYTHSDTLVLGVSLVNNCTPPNIKILKNLRPVLHVGNENQDDVNLSNFLNYEYRLYKLKQSFDCLDSVETFFQSEDEELQTNTWTADATRTLLPEGTAVLLLKLNVSQIVELKKCPLFLAFEVEKQIETDTLETFQLEIFLKMIDFEEILKERKLYELTFNQETLHQDFLAIAASNIETSLLIQYKSANDFIQFEQLLATKFDFKIFKREFLNKGTNDMDIDESVEQSNHSTTHMLMYNNSPHSMWYGLLLLRTPVTDEEKDDLKTHWKFYTPTPEKIFLLMKILFNDLLLVKCNISFIECLTHQKRKKDKLSVIEFENALRMELKIFMEKFNNRYVNNDLEKGVIDLIGLHLRSDLLANELVN